MKTNENYRFRFIYGDTDLKQEDTKNKVVHKPRLFVDMDGTLAEWRNIKIDINVPEEANVDELTKKLEKLDEVLYLPGYFRTLRPNVPVVNAVKQLIEQKEIEVYCLSCVKADKGTVSPLKEKKEWLDDYLPEIDTDHRIFVPDGQDKTKYIPGGIQETDFILDDYTKNLFDWENASRKGNGIKLLNNVNETKGEWKGNSVSFAKESSEIAETITAIINKSIVIKHESPRKDKNPVSHDEFLDMFQSVSLLNRVVIVDDIEKIPERLKSRMKEENWDERIFTATNNNNDVIYYVFYANIKDLEYELIDEKAGRTQKIIPDEIKNELESFLDNDFEQKNEVEIEK